MIGVTATSPVSTGGGGTFFEQHVDALFLALLLVRAPLPILKDCQVEEVHLQAEHLGWKTDDILVVARRPDGVVRQLAMQVKRQFAISERDAVCQKTFRNFWADFKGSQLELSTDRFALVTLRGTNLLLDTFNSLLDCARASVDAADFMRRLEVDGFLSKKARGYAATIRRILEDAGEAAPTDEEFWRFLSVLHVLSFDLNTASGQTEAWVKTLLAVSANQGDPLAVAEASWRELLELVSAGMPAAASYRYEDLPESLRNRHGPIDTRASQVIRALSAHSEITLDGIKTTIGLRAEITRDALISKVLEALNEYQVVVISAPAGLGKSVIAKRCIQLLGENLYCLAFRAEEFAVSHIDQMLQQAQVPANGAGLLGMLAGQGRKLVLVESIERLLEAYVRDAFADLLNLAQKDRNLGLLLTCRDYSLETVSSALLSETGLRFKVIEVPPLADEELEQVVAAVPHLANALKDERLKRLLRSPYLLDKAAQMDWSETKGLPTTEREFRERCWQEVIRKNAAAAGGMPQRREHTFLEVALRRARELRPFVPVADLDAAALEALRADGLIVTSPETSSQAAPAHDVLEDWAIIEWLGRRWILHERGTGALAEDVGGFPAVRRAYRKWLSELLQCETEAASDFVLSAFCDPTLPGYFRDDTLICALQSPSAREFLEHQREALFADGGALLIRVIHLLRVACKAQPWWLPDAVPAPSQMLIASGEAWPVVLEIVLAGLDSLLPHHAPVLLGLIEDFANSINWRQPEPKGFEEAAKIAFRLLEDLDDYRMDDMRKRTLKVIAKVPRGDSEAFRELVERAITAHRHDHVAGEMSEILLSGIDGWNACRFFPEGIIRLAEAKFSLREEDLIPDDWRRGSTIGVEPYFGIQERTHFDSFPASAIRGVFLPLLRYHPHRAVDFIIELLNHAGSWYGEQRWPYGQLEPAHQITIQVPGEAAVVQWANLRLWNLYRGLSVGPYVLQSALMALEAWLLGICDLKGVDVEPWLLKIIRKSNNVMATAVVASVCNAHPEKAGRAGLALLSSPELIRMDRARMVQEHAHSAMLGILPIFGINQIYEEERKKSNALPHRGHDLEALAVKLQFVKGQRETVFEIIDRHRASLPPEEEQSEEHRLWRLALHRMDVRGFRPVEEAEAEPTGGDASEEDETRERRIYLGPGEIEPDLQEIIDRHAPVAAQQEQDLALLNWGMAVWERRKSPHLDVSDWKTFLARARSRDVEPEPEDFVRGGPGVIAAVCARDRWDEMGPEEREWCIEKLIHEVERECDSEDDLIRQSREAFQPDRHAAYVLPGLLGRDVPDAQRARIRKATAKALTHASDEVRAYAAEGIGAFSTGELRAFSESCVAAIAARARLISKRLAEEQQKPYGERIHVAEILRDTVPMVRAAIIDQSCDLAKELNELALDDWPGRQAARTILQVFGYQLDSDLAIGFHRRVASSIVEEWDRELEDRTRRGRRDYWFNHEFFQRLARFVLRLDEEQALHVCEPFLAAVEKHPGEVKDFVRDLVIEADRSREDDSFWRLWQAFADAISAAPWIEHIDSRYGSGKELVDAIFLGNYWKENVRHWHRLEGQGHRVDKLAAQFRGSVTVFSAYCRLLYDIGESLLPKAFVLVADSLAAGESLAMLSDQNTVFLLESLLRRYVYSEPERLKSDPAIRRAVLALLDRLVEAGSSAAYRMRDDFVTPLRGSTN
jgi:hypothetical protein